MGNAAETEQEGALSIPPAEVDSAFDLHALANRWAEGIHEGHAIEFIDRGSKGVARKVPGDDNIRRVVEDDEQVIVQFSPSTTNLFLHWDKKRDVTHVIVNDQPALVAPDWLMASLRGLRRQQKKRGFLPGGVPDVPMPKLSVRQEIEFRLRMLWNAFFPARSAHPNSREWRELEDMLLTTEKRKALEASVIQDRPALTERTAS